MERIAQMAEQRPEEPSALLVEQQPVEPEANVGTARAAGADAEGGLRGREAEAVTAVMHGQEDAPPRRSNLGEASKAPLKMRPPPTSLSMKTEGASRPAMARRQAMRRHTPPTSFSR